jgi:hypothetical protein
VKTNPTEVLSDAKLHTTIHIIPYHSISLASSMLEAPKKGAHLGHLILAA